MRVFRRRFCWFLLGTLLLVPATHGTERCEHRCRCGQLADDRVDRANAIRRRGAGGTTGLDYQAELNAIKSAQGRLTADQRKAIDYWSRGGVLRWNEILIGLVARYNLPPVPNVDNSYPVPDANNPFADPQFPFANPPYAARAYSYVTVAQFDALKAAWYYKYLYNRPLPGG